MVSTAKLNSKKKTFINSNKKGSKSTTSTKNKTFRAKKVPQSDVIRFNGCKYTYSHFELS